jgi:hypothetical protein
MTTFTAAGDTECRFAKGSTDSLSVSATYLILHILSRAVTRCRHHRPGLALFKQTFGPRGWKRLVHSFESADRRLWHGWTGQACYEPTTDHGFDRVAQESACNRTVA